MDYRDLTLIAIVLSGVVFVFQVLLCIFVCYVFARLRRMQQTIERLLRTTATDNHNTESPHLGTIPRHLSLDAQPDETITVLYRDAYPQLPTQFANTEDKPQQTNPQNGTTKESSVEHINLGFENSSDKISEIFPDSE